MGLSTTKHGKCSYRADFNVRGVAFAPGAAMGAAR